MNKIPHQWKLVRLGDYCSLQNGYPFKSDQFNENEGVPLIRVRSLKIHNCDIKIQGNFDETYIVNNDDILIGMDGDFQPCLWRGGKALLNQRVCRLRNFEGDLDKEYAYHAIGKPLGKIENSTFYTTVKHLSSSKIMDIKIPLPPLPEQRAIARALRAVQGAREARLREVALERERKAALMEHLFTHGTRGEATKQTEIGEMPESWDAIQLESICIKIVDCPHSTPRFSSQGFLVARNFNIRCGKLDLTSSFFTTKDEYNERIKRCKPIEGDILFSREAPVGEACLIPPNIELCLGQRMMLLRADPLKMNNFFLVQTFYTNSIRSIMTANSSGVTAKHLNVADVKRLKIPYPSIEEQNYISTTLLACDSKIASLDHEAHLLDELFRAMLEEMMNGQLSCKGEMKTDCGEKL